MSATLHDPAVSQLLVPLGSSTEGYEVMHSASLYHWMWELMHYEYHFFSATFVMHNSSVDIVNAERPPTQLHYSDDKSTTKWRALWACGRVTGHWFIPSLYTDVGRLYSEPPLKLPHQVPTYQWHSEILIRMVYVPWWHEWKTIFRTTHGEEKRGEGKNGSEPDQHRQTPDL